MYLSYVPMLLYQTSVTIFIYLSHLSSTMKQEDTEQPLDFFFMSFHPSSSNKCFKRQREANIIILSVEFTFKHPYLSII